MEDLTKLRVNVQGFKDVNPQPGAERAWIINLADALRKETRVDEPAKALILCIFNINHCQQPMPLHEFREILAEYGWLGSHAYC